MPSTSIVSPRIWGIESTDHLVYFLVKVVGKISTASACFYLRYNEVYLRTSPLHLCSRSSISQSPCSLYKHFKAYSGFWAFAVSVTPTVQENNCVALVLFKHFTYRTSSPTRDGAKNLKIASHLCPFLCWKITSTVEVFFLQKKNVKLIYFA